jgi:subtilase family serine protease
VGFVSLSDASVSKPLLRKPLPMEQTAAYLAQAHGLLPQNTEFIDTSTYYDVGPQDFYTIYNETPLLTAASPINGTGQTIALLEESDIHTADVTTFRTMFKLTPNTPLLTVLHGAGAYSCGDPGILNASADNEEGEAVLDTEWVGAVAPNASLECPIFCAVGRVSVAQL